MYANAGDLMLAAHLKTPVGVEPSAFAGSYLGCLTRLRAGYGEFHRWKESYYRSPLVLERVRG